MPLDEIVRRLASLEDERAVLDLLHRYGHAIDYGREADWVDCFVEDGVFDRRVREDRTMLPEWRPLGSLEGRPALAEFVSRHSRAPERYHKHLVLSPRIELSGDEGTVQSYFVFATETEGRCEIGAFGRYRDRVARCPDGTWRFRERIAEIEAVGAAVPPPLRLAE
jgi:hypothetical protein